MGYHGEDGKYRNTRTARIPLKFVTKLNGTPIPDFTNEAQPSMGYDLADSESEAIRWNNDAAPGAVVGGFEVPSDRRPNTPMTVCLLASKSGATVGDTCPFTLGVFFQTVGALHDADADAGGDTTALVGGAPAKTVQKATRAIASADIPAPPAKCTVTCKPKATKLGTDDAFLHEAYVEYEQIIER
ncbi:MAG: hypothetical protein AMXMBFR56_76780 [Polyangiaceae bacterium]